MGRGWLYLHLEVPFGSRPAPLGHPLRGPTHPPTRLRALNNVLNRAIDPHAAQEIPQVGEASAHALPAHQGYGSVRPKGIEPVNDAHNVTPVNGGVVEAGTNRCLGLR